VIGSPVAKRQVFVAGGVGFLIGQGNGIIFFVRAGGSLREEEDKAPEQGEDNGKQQKMSLTGHFLPSLSINNNNMVFCETFKFCGRKQAEVGCR